MHGGKSAPRSWGMRLLAGWLPNFEWSESDKGERESESESTILGVDNVNMSQKAERQGQIGL